MPITLAWDPELYPHLQEAGEADDVPFTPLKSKTPLKVLHVVGVLEADIKKLEDVGYTMVEQLLERLRLSAKLPKNELVDLGFSEAKSLKVVNIVSRKFFYQSGELVPVKTPWTEMNSEQLQKLCEERGLAKSGTNKELLERVLDAEIDADHGDNPVYAKSTKAEGAPAKRAPAKRKGPPPNCTPVEGYPGWVKETRRRGETSRDAGEAYYVYWGPDGAIEYSFARVKRRFS